MIGSFAGGIIPIFPKHEINGINTNQPRTPPANKYEEIFIPQIYPTPANAGKTSKPIPVRKGFKFQEIEEGNNFIPSAINLYNAAIPNPEKTIFDFSPPSSPAKSTSAQAVPSGKGKTPCSSTINALRSGIINNVPKSPPNKAINVMFQNEGDFIKSLSDAHINNAGIVKIAPAASDSPAEPIV